MAVDENGKKKRAVAGPTAQWTAIVSSLVVGLGTLLSDGGFSISRKETRQVNEYSLVLYQNLTTLQAELQRQREQLAYLSQTCVRTDMFVPGAPPKTFPSTPAAMPLPLSAPPALPPVEE